MARALVDTTAPWRRGSSQPWTSTSSFPVSPDSYAPSTRRPSPRLRRRTARHRRTAGRRPRVRNGRLSRPRNRGRRWDAIVALLVALDADHHDRFHAVMSGCRRLSNSTPEVDGLDDLLTEPEQRLHDVALDRESRRSQQGYSTAADARAFLLMARQRHHPSNGDPSSIRSPRRTIGPPHDTAGPENDVASNPPRTEGISHRQHSSGLPREAIARPARRGRCGGQPDPERSSKVRTTSLASRADPTLMQRP